MYVRAITSEISKRIREMHEYTNAATFDRKLLLEKLAEIEDMMDAYLSSINYGDRITDTKFKAVKACIDEYVSLVKSIKKDILDSNVTDLRDDLVELDEKVRELVRTINILRSDSTGISALEIMEDAGVPIGFEDLSDIDSRIDRLSPVAKRLIRAVVDSPVKSIGVSEAAKRIGMVDDSGRPTSSFKKVLDEILSTIPEYISIEPMKSGKGTVIRWRGW